MQTDGKTPTIRQFLMSKMVDSEGRSNGYNTDLNDIYGDFKGYQEIVDNGYKELFKRIYISQPVTDRFKKDFCVRFYNKSIGYETFEQFFVRVSDVLNTKCFNWLKNLEELRNLSTQDALNTTDMKTDSDFKNRNKSLGMGETRPDNYKEISYSQDYDDVTINYADDLNENRGNAEGETHSHTYGKNTRPLYQELNDLANMEDLQNKIFDEIEDTCFNCLY